MTAVVERGESAALSREHSALHCTVIMFTALHWSALKMHSQSTELHFKSVQCSALQFSKLQHTVLHCNAMCHIINQCIALNCFAQHHTLERTKAGCKQTSLLRRLQAHTLSDATPPLGKISPIHQHHRNF